MTVDGWAAGKLQPGLLKLALQLLHDMLQQIFRHITSQQDTALAAFVKCQQILHRKLIAFLFGQLISAVRIQTGHRSVECSSMLFLLRHNCQQAKSEYAVQLFRGKDSAADCHIKCHEQHHQYNAADKSDCGILQTSLRHIAAAENNC